MSPKFRLKNKDSEKFLTKIGYIIWMHRNTPSSSFSNRPIFNQFSANAKNRPDTHIHSRFLSYLFLFGSCSVSSIWPRIIFPA